jgi:hypothetical protein
MNTYLTRNAMNYHELLEEIRENRKEIKKLHQDFYIFKGKAYGFIGILSIIINVAIKYSIK